MSEFNVSDRVLAVIPGQCEYEIVEGFVTAVEQDGRIVAVRPATTHEWETDEMDPSESGVSWWWGSESVFHVTEAERAVEAKESMTQQWQDALRHGLVFSECNPQGGCDDEPGVDP
jgi:hypothetical protein